MNASPLPRPRLARLMTLLVAVLFLLSACRAVPPGLFGPDPDARPEPSPTPIAKTMCESGADLRVDVDVLRSVEVSEDGLLALLVAVDAAVGEAQTLGTLVGQEYQPLVSDLVLSLQDLGMTVEELGGQATLGAGLAAVGGAITGIGEAMDTLALQLREPCPEGLS